MLIDLNRAITNYIKKFGQSLAGKRILDLGCGTGYYTCIFGKKNDVIGIDIQNVVRSECRNFDFRLADVTNLPFEKDNFDVVVSFDVIEHVEEDKKMMAEAYRVLKNNGRIFLGTPNRMRLSHFVLGLIGRPVKYPLDLGRNELGKIIHLREYSSKELEILAKRVDFKNIRVFPFWFGLAPLKYGFMWAPKFFQQYCHYWFLEAEKIHET